MIPDPSPLEAIAKHLKKALPDSFANIQEDVDKNLRSTLKIVLERMDLVTREEFDIQKAVLLRTREKLDALEARVAALEAEPSALENGG